MININYEITNILLPLNIPLYYEDAKLSDDVAPSEYIVFHKIYGDERRFSDNVAKSEYFYYRINVFAMSAIRLHEIMDGVVSAMKRARWYIHEKNISIPREKGAEFYGAYSEFSKEVYGIGDSNAIRE